MTDFENTSKKSTRKLQDLQDIEVSVQKLWAAQRVFEVDAPAEHSPQAQQPKYMVTFPYPYMNGRLHLGHAFTVSKAEFAVGYQRLKGVRTLFPFGFHCTGMPIKACADKLKHEIEKFGNPPNFPTSDILAVDNTKQHSKVLAKTGDIKYQWEIMRSMGVPEHEIVLFADEHHWLKYFPPLAIQDLTRFGLKADWRRSFITTDINPYYDSFIRWQFETLRDLGKIKFGKRFTVYSPLDGQACMDHDRSEGEGSNPQEYTLIKLQLLSPFPVALASLEERQQQCPVYLVAATLRPETMYGQTNCWVGPEITYGAFVMKDNSIFICTQRAMRNMAHQEQTATFGKITQLLTVHGSQLIGAAVKAPLSFYEEKVYVLPMMGVSAEKGSGIVTSVPSDSPHDYAALRDLQKKPAFRERFHLTDDQVMPFHAVPIVDSGENLGHLCAVTVCDQLGVVSQNDTDKLEKCKEIVYLRSFYEGRMLVGPYAGQSVKDAKPLIRQLLMEKGFAIPYYEPERRVKSRSGDECVVSLIDQWYLNYGEPQWRDETRACLGEMRCFSQETFNQFDKTLDWLNQWACSRSFGLGSHIPWDPQFLIESLSDSTIYMAYYTVCHMLQKGVLDGHQVGCIPPDKCTRSFWDYVLLGKKDGSMPTGIDTSSLQALRREVTYWYPFDLRVSGKDLIPNHLTFCLYNHVAIFPETMWPKGMRANGHLLVNKEKMAKSKGNFKTIHDMMREYGADATRIALADAGDSLDDANFATTVAESAILRLYTLLEWCREMKRALSSLNDEQQRTSTTQMVTLRRRGSEYTFADRVFESEMNRLIGEADRAYSLLNFRDALKSGFFDLQLAKDRYREVNAVAGMHGDLVMRYIEVQTLLMAPIAPHVAEYMWRELLQRKSLMEEARWPQAGVVDDKLLLADKYLQITSMKFRQLQQTGAVKKGDVKNGAVEKPAQGEVWVATRYPAWQEKAIEILKSRYDETLRVFSDERSIVAALKEDAMLQPIMKKVMPFVMMIKEKTLKEGVEAMALTLPFNEKEVLENNVDYLCRTLDLMQLHIHVIDNEQALEALGKKAALARPGEPAVHFE